MHPDAAPDFVAWYEAEACRVLLTLRAALGDNSLAEESVAEAFARAFAQWTKVSVMKSPTGWVYRVALNYARTQLRRHRRELERSIQVYAGPVAPGPEPQDPIWSAVAELSPASRLAIALRYVADLEESEIATLMRVSRGTVATTLHRARASLAERVHNNQEEHMS